MRIAVFIKSTTFHKGFGGLETQNKMLCEGLYKAGYSVTVFSPKKDVEHDFLELHGVQYVFVPCKFKMGAFLGFFGELDRENWINKSAEAFKQIHVKYPFDLVIGQSSAALGIIRVKQSISVKVVSICHGSTLSEYRTFLGEVSGVKDLLRLIPRTGYVLKNFFTRQREFVHGSDHIVAVSSFVKKYIVEETFVDDNKVTVILNGIDHALFSKHTRVKGIEGKDIKIVSTSRVVKSKGVFNLVKSFAELLTKTAKPVTLHIINDGADLVALKEFVASLKIQDKVIFYGSMPHEAVLSKLLNFDIFVLPSLRVEGLPMTLPEAMFAELPIVASNIGGIPDAVRHEYNGLLVPPGDVPKLTQALLRLVDNKDLCVMLGNNGRKFALEEFTLTKMVAKYVDIINNVLE